MTQIDPGPGWRLLKAGEVKPQGYEYKSPNFGWIKGEGAGDVVIAYGFPCRVRAIPADRVLGEGMVAVDRQLLLDVEDALGCAEGLGPCGLGLLCQVQDALRANQGGATRD